MRRVSARQSANAEAEKRELARRESEFRERERQNNFNAERSKYVESLLIAVANSARNRRDIQTVPIYIMTDRFWGGSRYTQVGSGWRIVFAKSPGVQDYWSEYGPDPGRRGVVLRSDGRAFYYSNVMDDRTILKSADSRDGGLSPTRDSREECSQVSLLEDRELILEGLEAFAAEHHLQVREV